MIAEGDAYAVELARGALDGTLSALGMLALDRCDCGGEGFARFSVRVEVAGPWPSWLPVNDRSTTVCRDCAARSAGISGEVARAAESIAVEDAPAVDVGTSSGATVTPIRPGVDK